MKNRIFSIDVEDKYLVFYFLGFKIVIKSKTQNNIYNLNNEYNDLKNKYSNLINKFDYLNDIVLKNWYGESKLLEQIKKFKISKVKNEKIKSIFTINTLAKRGGASKIAYTITNEIGKFGYKNFMYTSGVHENLVDENNIKFISLLDSKEYSFVKQANKQLGYQDFFFKNSFDIKNTKEFIQSDILHLHNLHGEYFSIFALPELTALKPTIWTLHDELAYTGHCGGTLGCNKWENNNCKNCPNISLYQELPFDTASFILENKKNIYENIDVTITCPSMWLVNRAKKSILKNHDIRLIHNGIDNKIFKPLNQKGCRAELGLPQDKKILLFSSDGGTSNPWKGGEYILKTYEAFKNDPNLLFIDIGANKDSIINGNYKMVPYINDETVMAKYYSASDLFIYPSLADSFGLVVAESISSSLPVITFNTGGIPEVIEHMKTGYIAEQRNIEDFINGIKIFLQDEKLLKNAKELGPKVVKEKFTNEIMVKNYLKLYNEVFELRKKQSGKKHNLKEQRI